MKQREAEREKLSVISAAAEAQEQADAERALHEEAQYRMELQAKSSTSLSCWPGFCSFSACSPEISQN